MSANPVAQKAATLCKNQEFGLYLDWKRRRQNKLTHEQLPDGTHSEDDARHAICCACKVKSRRDIVAIPQSLQMFNRIVADFHRWKRHKTAGGMS